MYQLVAWLEENGVQCDVHPLVDEQGFLKSRKRGNTLWKAQLLARAFAQRLRLAKRADQYDLVYILKGAFMYGPPWIERRIRKSGVPMIFDFDDAIFIHKSSTANGIMDRFRFTNRIPETVKMVDRIVVPNSYLADYSRKLNSNVTIVPEAEDTVRFTARPKHRPSEKIVIGWIGSPSTVKYLSLIQGALQEICRRHSHVVIRSVGGHFECQGVRTENVPWTLEQEIQNFHASDIGIMPLPMEEWSKGKSGCKLRQYMASGVPAVATKIGYNRELVNHSGLGFLVESKAEWVEALEKLILDHELRNSIAMAARESVVQRFSIPVIGPQLLAAFQQTIRPKQGTET